MYLLQLNQNYRLGPRVVWISCFHRLLLPIASDSESRVFLVSCFCPPFSLPICLSLPTWSCLLWLTGACYRRLNWHTRQPPFAILGSSSHARGMYVHKIMGISLIGLGLLGTLLAIDHPMTPLNLLTSFCLFPMLLESSFWWNCCLCLAPFSEVSPSSLPCS